MTTVPCTPAAIDAGGLETGGDEIGGVDDTGAELGGGDDTAGPGGALNGCGLLTSAGGLD